MGCTPPVCGAARQAAREGFDSPAVHCALRGVGHAWRVRLAVRPPRSQRGYRGSTPLLATSPSWCTRQHTCLPNRGNGFDPRRRLDAHADVAQPGRALSWYDRGRRFDSGLRLDAFRDGLTGSDAALWTRKLGFESLSRSHNTGKPVQHDGWCTRLVIARREFEPPRRLHAVVARPVRAPV